MIKVAPRAQIALQHTALHLAPAEDDHIAVFSTAEEAKLECQSPVAAGKEGPGARAVS